MSGTTGVFQLQYRETGNETWVNWGIPIIGNSEIVTGLRSATSYDFQVINSNDAGSVISPTVTIITPGQAATPQGALAVINGIGSAQVAVSPLLSKATVLLPGVVTVTTVATTLAGHNVGTTINGAGSVAALAVLASWGVTLSGVGSVTATGSIPGSITANFVGVGSVTANSLHVVQATATIVGVGATTATTGHFVFATCTIPIAGSVTIAGIENLKSIVAIPAAGSVATTANAILTQQWSATHLLTNVPGTGATITLSNSNLTATEAVAADDGPVFAAVTATAGKYYWELFISCADPSQITVGFGNINAGDSTNQWIGSDANAVGWLGSNGGVACNGNNGSPNIATWATWTSGATLGFALDLDNNLIWARVGSGLWNNSASANPSNGTSGGGIAIPTSVLTASVGPGCTLSAVGDFCIGQFLPSSWLFSAPTPFVPWSNVYNPSLPVVTIGTITNTSVAFTWTASVGSTSYQPQYRPHPTTTPQTWSPTSLRHDSQITLSNGNPTASMTGAAKNALAFGLNAFPSASGGRYYFEVTVNFSSATSVGLGNTNSAVGGTSALGGSLDQIGWRQDGTVLNNGNPLATWAPYTTGQTVCIAFDITNNLIWGKVAAGHWNNSPTANPSNGLSGGGVTIPSGVYAFSVLPAIMLTQSTLPDHNVGAFSSAAWTYAAPIGFATMDVTTSSSWINVGGVITVPPLTATATSLTALVAYDFQVVANNSHGSVASTLVTATTT